MLLICTTQLDGIKYKHFISQLSAYLRTPLMYSVRIMKHLKADSLYERNGVGGKGGGSEGGGGRGEKGKTERREKKKAEGKGKGCRAVKYFIFTIEPWWKISELRQVPNMEYSYIGLHGSAAVSIRLLVSQMASSYTSCKL